MRPNDLARRLRPPHFPRLPRHMFAAAVIALAAASSALPAFAVPPAVLSQLPSDAKYVIVVNNLKDLNTKVGKAAATLNLPAPPDLLGYLTRKGGIDKAFDANNSAAAVMLPGDGEDGKPPLVVLLPTTDPKVMLAGFQPTEPDKAGIMEVTPPEDNGEKSYAAVVGKWVALSPIRSGLETYMARTSSLDKSLPAETLKIFEANDLVVWANMEQLQKEADMALDSGQQLLDMGMSQAAGRQGADATIAAFQKAVMKEYFLGMKEYCHDSSAAMLTVRLTDAGPTLGMVAMFKPDSPFGKFVAAQKGVKPASLEGLADGHLLAAFAMNWDPGSTTDVLDLVSKHVLGDETVAQDPKIDDYRKIAQQYIALCALAHGAAWVLIEPPAGGKGPWLNGAALIHSSDPAKYLAIQMELLRGPISKFSLSGDIKQNFSVTEGAQTVKGVKFNKIQMDWKLREATDDKPLLPGSQKAIDMIHKMYGEQGMIMYVGVVGSNVLTVFGSDAATMESAVNAAQANADDLAKNPQIAASKEQVLPGAQAVAYLPVSRWIGIAQSMMPGGGGAGAAGAGANDPPIVISAVTSGSTLTMEMHVPIATIGTIKDAAMGMMGMFMMNDGGRAAPQAVPPMPMQ